MEVIHVGRIRKQGGSLIVTVPHHAAVILGLKQGSFVSIRMHKVKK